MLPRARISALQYGVMGQCGAEPRPHGSAGHCPRGTSLQCPVLAGVLALGGLWWKGAALMISEWPLSMVLDYI